MEPKDLPEGENRWFCPNCVIQDVSRLFIHILSLTFFQNPPTKPSVGLKFMSPLIQQLQCTPPLEFRLPDEIRTTFKDGMNDYYQHAVDSDIIVVATGSKGAYVDTSRLKPPRLKFVFTPFAVAQG